jgi:hypothetical protein
MHGLERPGVRDRAFRRAQMERWKRRVVDYYGGYMKPEGTRLPLSEDERARHIGMAARTRHRCSCMGCGNPRRWSNGKWFGRTMQERRAEQAARDAEVR